MTGFEFDGFQLPATYCLSLGKYSGLRSRNIREPFYLFSRSCLYVAVDVYVEYGIDERNASTIVCKKLDFCIMIYSAVRPYSIKTSACVLLDRRASFMTKEPIVVKQYFNKHV